MLEPVPATVVVAPRREFSHAADAPIGDRLENWGRCYRDRLRRGELLSAEGRYRNRWARHWDYDAEVGVAPNVTPANDWVDAALIDGAWQALESPFHATLLAAWYVHARWTPFVCLALARQVAGERHVRRGRRAAEFEAHLTMAQSLLVAQLALPAVFRRVRLVARIRAALELDHWG